MGNKLRNSVSVAIKVAAIGVLFLYFCSMVFLHYQQLNPDELAKGMLSDLPAHLKWGLEGESYSINGVLLKNAFLLAGNVGVSVLLTIMELLTIFGLTLTFCYFTHENWEKALLFAIVCSIEMAIHFDGQYWYLGTITGAIYHNSTYISMQVFAVPTFLLFLHVYREIDKKINKKYWLMYTVFLTLTTACKPSFLFGFAPTLLLILIVDFIKTRGHNLINEILLGISVFPSVPIGLFQATFRYTAENKSKIIFNPLVAWDYLSNHTIGISLLRSITFVTIVLLVAIAVKKIDKIYIFSVVFLGVTLAEGLLLAESGTTQNDGNIFWTAYSAMMICFTVSAAMLYNITKEQFKSGTGNTLVKGAIVLGWIAFAGHVLCGCTYIFLQITGQYML